MTDNLINTGKLDEKVFLEFYPDKIPITEEYINRMDKVTKFTGILPEPTSGSNKVPMDEDLFKAEEIRQYINETETTYRLLKEAAVDFVSSKNEGFKTDNICIPKTISELYLINPGVYDKKTVYSVNTADAIIRRYNKNYEVINSKVTFILSLAAAKHINEKVEYKDEVKSLLTTIVNVFHPNVAAELIMALDSVNIIYYLLGEERLPFIRQLYETLVMREGIFISQDPDYFSTGYNNGFTSEDLVAYKFGSFVFDDPLQILDDKNHFNWFGTILNVPAYDNHKKYIYTNILLDLIHTPDKKTGYYENMNKANRYIREVVTSWIKTPDIEKRPKEPDPFQYINISAYLKAIYTHGIYTIGDMNKYIGEYEIEKEKTEAAYKEIKDTYDKGVLEHTLEGDEKDVLTLKLYEAKDAKDKAYSAYLEHLRNKSLIEFLFLEILGNEKAVATAFDFNLVAFVLEFEPDKDNAMHTTYSAICSLYVKRDFKPMGSLALNPYYIHANEGDIITPETKWLARIMSGIANYNMGSRIACSFVNLPTELANVITSVEYTVQKAKIDCAALIKVSSNEAISLIEKNGLFKESNIVELIKDIDILDGEQMNNLVVAINGALKEIKNIPKDHEIDLSVGKLSYRLDKLKTALINYTDIDWGFKNIYKELSGILTRLPTLDAIFVAQADIHHNNKQYSFWPRIKQYYHEIKENSLRTTEEIMHDKYIDLMPGDLESGRYLVSHDRTDDRFSTSKACD